MFRVFDSLRAIWRRYSWHFVNLCLVVFPVALAYLIEPRESPVEFTAAMIVYLIPVLWAWWLAHSARKVLGIEEALLIKIEANGAALERELEKDTQKPTVDGQFWARFLPNTELRDGVTLTSVRMVQSLCHEAVSGRFPPISATSQIYSNEILDRVRRLRAPQTLALRLGILGTFIGLLLSLGQLAQIFSAGDTRTTEETWREVLKLIYNMKVAFGTSVAGLLAATLIQLYGESLGVRFERITKQIEDTVGRVVHVLTTALAGSQLVRSAEALAERMDRQKREMNDHASNVQSATAKSIRAVRRYGHALKEGVSALRGGYSALSDVAGHHTALMEELRSGLTRIAAMDTRLETVLQKNLDALRDSTEGLSDASVAAVKEVLGPVSEGMTERNELARESVRGLQQATARIEELVGVLARTAEGIAAERKDHATLIAALDRLAESLVAQAAAGQASGGQVSGGQVSPGQAGRDGYFAHGGQDSRQAEHGLSLPSRWPQHALWATAISVLILHAVMVAYLFRSAWMN